jgi:hypothetical protein
MQIESIAADGNPGALVVGIGRGLFHQSASLAHGKQLCCCTFVLSTRSRSLPHRLLELGKRSRHPQPHRLPPTSTSSPSRNTKATARPANAGRKSVQLSPIGKAPASVLSSRHSPLTAASSFSRLIPKVAINKLDSQSSGAREGPSFCLEERQCGIEFVVTSSRQRIAACFPEREKQEVFPAAPRDGFTAVRKTSNDPRPLDQDRRSLPP